MYGPGLKVVVAKDDHVSGEPIERLDIEMVNGTKNVLLVLKVDPMKATQEMVNQAAEWLGEQCRSMSSRLCQYHGIVLTDNNEYKLDLVEVDTPIRVEDDEVTRP